MGAQTSNGKNQQKHQRILIENYYHTKLFIKHKKSNEQFQQELVSISKRSSCLAYQWATELSTFLKSNESHKLYTQYKSILKENCLKEGKKEKIFGSSIIKKSFFQSLKIRSEKISQTITISELNQIFEQSKAYFMVTQWLHRLVSPNNNSHDQQNNNTILESTIEVEQQQRIFEILLNLSIQMFKSNVHEQLSKKVYKKQQLYSNIELFKLFKSLNNNMKFIEKEILIEKIQKSLLKNVQEIGENVEKLTYFFGSERVFGYLFTIKEIGRINISFLWRHFCQKTYQKILAHQQI